MADDTLTARQTLPITRPDSLMSRLWHSRIEYLFLVPGMLIFGAFILYPIFASQYFSLLNWSGFDANQTFVGLANYAELLTDKYFWDAFGRSFLFTMSTVPLQMLVSLVFAIILNNKLIKLSTLFRTLIFLPVVTPVAVIGIVMAIMLSPFNGPINLAMLDIGLLARPLDFLGDPKLVLWTLAGIYVWKWVGVTMVYWLAALQTVPAELYEASKLDGVKNWQVTVFVVLPMIMPFAIVIALISAIGALNVFPLVQSMTQGGPFFASEVIEVYIFRNAFATAGAVPRLGYASAAGVFFGFAIMGLTILQIVAVRHLRNREKTNAA
ncbi:MULTISPECIES: carbohydrate ABC transporter permease [unclassified Shinella]|uniref:carbohydrate ABC transporter permease n=1 Tax=unclassified Shinella TaxID=2643062 RepID=UPI00225C6D8F|nr:MULTISPECIES: sugar ABC transporter permease [unclassified Shinella]CAI0333914.1 Sugar ABC transporter permease [Rhizobiaceae bacterium]CAK7261556.1 multiple sugar transport system permease protein [Shinella sp. WSC3-e]MDC7259741.1 sugar ABC transporter permease [Shinella sp. YE25]MDC7267088.1 sugar ABC transporter permease [Shinella sp. HY16]MDC7273985.1 sugar ABC transporter permease [Shinella sp. YZ44]